MTEEQNLTKKQRRELRRQEKQAKQEAEVRKQKYRSLMIWGIVLFVLVGIVWLMVRAGGTTPGTDPNANQTDILSSTRANAHIKGNPDAEVKLVEYSDFQCPACAAFFPIVQKLEEDLGDRLAIEYRHFPLRQIHPNADLAARAAVAASFQGKFWEMHDLLFEGQTIWSNFSGGQAKDKFEEYAVQLELDLERFKDDIDSSEAKEIVNNDVAGGFQVGVNSTPSFYINGVKVRNTTNYNDFREIIESEINWNS